MHNAVDPYRHTLWVYVRESLCLCVVVFGGGVVGCGGEV